VKHTSLPANGHRIALTGYFWRGNLGDDAMLEGLDACLRDALPSAQIDCVPLPATAEMWRVPGFLRRLSRADWIVLSGGSHFHDSMGLKSLRLLVQFLALFQTLAFTGSRLAFAGIGIGPLRSATGRRIVSRLLELSSCTVVRDSVSLSIAESLRPGMAHAGFDLAILNSKPGVRSVPQVRRLGVSVTGDLERSYAGMGAPACPLDAFAEALVETGIEAIEIYPFCTSPGYTDLPISEHLYKKLKPYMETGIVTCESPGQVRNRLANLDAFCGARFHSILLAYEAGLPILPIVYHPKCDALADELGLSQASRLRREDLQSSERVSCLLQQLVRIPDSMRPSLPYEDATSRSTDAMETLVNAIKEYGQ